MRVIGLAGLLVAASVGQAAGSIDGQLRAVKPKVAPYHVKANLSNISNLKLFSKELSAAEKKMLAKNQFVVTPTNYVQLFHIYENNEYQRPYKFPAFITTDAMLHTYHVFYNYSLRTVESTKLYDACLKLTDQMLQKAEKDYSAASGKVKRAALRNVAYFAVGKGLLTGKAPDSSVPEAKALAYNDYAKVMAHASRAATASVGSKIDFTQFVPRGHYTRTERLKRYFRAMMWFGLTPFDLKDLNQTRQALLITRIMRIYPDEAALWRTVYEPTSFYVGESDDLSPAQYGPLAFKLFGKSPALSAYESDTAVAAFAARAKALRGPRIEIYSNDAVPGNALTVGKQFRFMGQRFILDSRILQELTHPKVGRRTMPSGLDVFAALGSDRALQIQKGVNQAFQPSYDVQMAKMRRELSKTTTGTWTSNLYYGWLWTLRSLCGTAGAGYPSFMQTAAWRDKNLLTCMGSWTELRHDTILYAKQSVSECGGDEEKEPPVPTGYVEPNLEFWLKLKWLNDATLTGLAKRNLLTAKLKDDFRKIGDLLDLCTRVTVKELTGKKVTRSEYQEIQLFGAELDSLNMDFAGGDIISEADLDMAVVADVHSSLDKVLEEGTGRAAAIYVVVPINGKLVLTRGAVFTQYEFTHSASDRLTDEKWQSMLKQGRVPNFAPWTKSFLIPKKKKLKDNFEAGNSGC